MPPSLLAAASSAASEKNQKSQERGTPESAWAATSSHHCQSYSTLLDLRVVLRSALTCRPETGSPVPAEYGVSRHPTRARPVDSGEGKGAGPGAAWLQTKESLTPWSRPTDLPLLLLDLPPRSQRSLFHRPAFPYLRVQPTRCASQGDPRSSKAKVWEG